MRWSSTKRLVTALFLIFFGSPHVLAADEPEGDGHGASHHHLEATFGAAFNDEKSGIFTGFEYEYRISDLVGVGGFIDGTFGGFDLAAIGVVANFHPAGAWKVITGVGVERKTGGGKNKTLVRFGGAYKFHVGNGTISPTVAYDFLEDSKDVIYVGVALGFSF